MTPNFLYQLSHKLENLSIPIIPKLLTYMIRLIFSAYIPSGSKIGKDIVFGYGGLGIVIHKNAVLGSGCHLSQNVTIGGTSKKEGVPIIGNDVYIGAGAVVIGPVTIGDNVVIGANSVVVNDIESNSLVVGIPAKVIKSGILKSDYV
ncbi:serine acetyltransferase [Vibrio sp. ED004]|uniref:serine O-acetyltransferase n=1 Tax=Vibrio sp. ED004 TaxID=2785124 RepID=UPI002059AF6D|nr:DapH/DapD/GlmU-related protein [Vibrio sp. ED004]UPR55349.1 serine acetyltransferase [Vibrio sp. ED004]